MTTPQLLSRASDKWPSQLDDVQSPPKSLYALGDLSCLRAPLCAVVGTRMATDYGTRVTTQLVGALAGAGVGIVSGMARGIDAMAHRAALDAGGRTIAVLGTGIDVPYPASHRALHERIATEGLVLSESGPGVGARPGCFPKRNRIIAGLAPVTLVVEAGFKSGAHITASAAIDANRTVAAVPGPIDSPQSAGANALIVAGAQVVTCAADLFALLGLAPPVSELIDERLDGDARSVWRALERDALFFEDLAAAADLPMPRVLSAVTELEIAGRVVVGVDDRVRRALPAARI
jgi:DNA processing protein